MRSYKDSVEKYIQEKIFLKTGENYFDCSLQEDCLYKELDSIGKDLCLTYIKGYSSFYLIDSIRVQAGAIHTHQAVLVFKGMLELIFRTSSMMVGAERRRKEANKEFYEPWHNDLSSWINGGVFDWSNDQYWWLHDQAYRKQFNMLVEGMFVFLVLHEIGHLHNLHGERRYDNTKEKSSSMDHIIFIHKAVEDTEKMDEVERLEAHTREIVADTYAFQLMLSDMKPCYTPASAYKGVEDNNLSMVNFAVCIYVVASFLWALSFKRPMNNNTQSDNYPSHVFRLHSISAASFEHKICGDDRTLTTLGMEYGIKTGIANLEHATGNNEFTEWLCAADTPENYEHYKKICAITGRWSNVRFGVRDED